jgi:hypothetical protein
MTVPIYFLMFVAAALLWAVMRARKKARVREERVRFIRGYRFPPGLKYKLDQAYPDLSDEQIKHILDGLRTWFVLHAETPGRHFGMPSKAVDTAWHEFILLTKTYAVFCDHAFGKFLHHTPHVGDAKAEQDGLAWTWGSRASLLGAGVAMGGLGAAALLAPAALFSMDKDLGIAGGNAYSPTDFEQLDKRHSQLAAASSSGDGGGSDGSTGGSTSCGDSGSCGDGGGGGGCGGGCGS